MQINIQHVENLLVTNGCRLVSPKWQFFGTMLKMSILDLKLGYNTYWAKEQSIHAGTNYEIKLGRFTHWVKTL